MLRRAGWKPASRMCRSTSSESIWKVVPAARDHVLLDHHLPKSLQPMCSAAWATPPPMVTQEAWKLGTLSRTSRASALTRR